MLKGGNFWRIINFIINPKIRVCDSNEKVVVVGPIERFFTDIDIKLSSQNDVKAIVCWRYHILFSSTLTLYLLVWLLVNGFSA